MITRIAVITVLLFTLTAGIMLTASCETKKLEGEGSRVDEWGNYTDTDNNVKELKTATFALG